MMRTTHGISMDPGIMAGQPVIRGTRITAALVLRELGRGATPAEIVDHCPHLVIDDIRAARTWAAKAVSGETLGAEG